MRFRLRTLLIVSFLVTGLLGRFATSQTTADGSALALTRDEQEQQTAALVELEILGAKVLRSRDTVESIELGDEFHGKVHDLERLKRLVNVPVLILSGEKVGDDWIKLAATMTRLKEVHLYQARLSDDGLAPLAGLTKLEQIGLYYTGIGNMGLRPLMKLPSIRVVRLYGTQVTPTGVEQLRAGKRNVLFDYRARAYLGIGGSFVDKECCITAVADGSPAEKAGLLREDVILRIGENAVLDFKQLTEIISQRNVGDMVEIVVTRRDDNQLDARQMLIKVTLAPFPLAAVVPNAGHR